MQIAPIDTNKLYDVTSITDMETGEVLVYTPISVDGEFDSARSLIFKGRTTIQARGGPPLSVNFELGGKTLTEALSNWQGALEAALKEFESRLMQERILKARKQ
jgi:hypothetical protein